MDLGWPKITLLGKLKEKGAAWFLSTVGVKPQIPDDTDDWIEETMDQVIKRGSRIWPDDFKIFWADYVHSIDGMPCKDMPRRTRAEKLGIDYNQYRAGLRRFRAYLTKTIERDYPQLIDYREYL